MKRDWDLILHFDSRRKLFLKRDYEHDGDYFSRIYLKTAGRERELLELLNWWHEKNNSRFLGGTFKLNNYGEILRNKKLIGKVKEFPSFIDFIIDRRTGSEVCKKCGHDLLFAIQEYEHESLLVGECENNDCDECGTIVQFFRVKFVEHACLSGLPEFSYEHPIDYTRLYKCLLQEYNLYWRRVQD